MKNVKLTILTVGLLLAISSCCTKKDCEDAGAINIIEFYNFNKQDVDTIIVYSYTRNTGFTTPIDSLKTSSCEGSGDPYYVYTSELLFERDYKIKLVATGQTFAIINIVTEEKGCNSCFPYRPKSDYYIRMKNYQLNEQTKDGPRIQINN